MLVVVATAHTAAVAHHQGALFISPPCTSCPSHHQRGAAAVPLPAWPAPQAPTVISAAGSLHTPALLLRSGITCGGRVGANLRLHPCTCVVGLFPEQARHGGATAAPAGPACADVEDLCAPAAAGGGGGGASASQRQQQPQRKLDMAGGGGSIRCWEGVRLLLLCACGCAGWRP